MQKGAKKRVWVLSALMLLCFSLAVFGQTGTIADRETADDYNPKGYAKWIKVTVAGGVGTNERLNNNFGGMQVLVDLNIDGDNNYHTPLNIDPQGLGYDSYYADGDAGDIRTARSGEEGDGDLIFYVAIKPIPTLSPSNTDDIAKNQKNIKHDGTGWDTHIRPRIQLTNSGSLRIISGTFQFSIINEADLFPVKDGIKPFMRFVYYYDDGTGNTDAAAGVHKGNKTPYDGYLDRIDIMWSEPMNGLNLSVNESIFKNIVDRSANGSVYGFETQGQWNDDGTTTTDNFNRRFTMYIYSFKPNSGAAFTLNYIKPVVPADQFKEATNSQNQWAADSHLQTVTDKAGPAIISAQTVRPKRRFAAAATQDSARIEVTFSEAVVLNSTALDVEPGDLAITMQSVAKAIQRIVSPTSGSSSVYIFKLVQPFTTVNDTGNVRYSNFGVVQDVAGNQNSAEALLSPHHSGGRTAGPKIPITDGIYPNITKVETVDAILNAQLASGGANGWGYLDYIEVTFDHTMDQTRRSTSGFTIKGLQDYAVGGTGDWLDPNYNVFRIPIAQAGQKLPDTWVRPVVEYLNPGNPNGLRDATNNGLAENLYKTDVALSDTNALALQSLDKAGPAVVESITAGKKRIRLRFSERIKTNKFLNSVLEWPDNPAEAITDSKFKWIVGTSRWDATNLKVYFTGLTGTNRDSIIYLNHNNTAWTKSDSGVINFQAQNEVLDLVSNGNSQYDNDAVFAITNVVPSDVKIRKDNIPPILELLATRDLNLNGKLDHYYFRFTDISPIYPKLSFKKANWQITSDYDGAKNVMGMNLNAFTNPNNYDDMIINQFGDTVGVYIQFAEIAGVGPEPTPYGGDTGDVPDVIVAASKGFADWADNYMNPLASGFNETVHERDGAGPAIIKAKTINTTEVDAFMSERLLGTDLRKDLFYLDMGLAPGHELFFLDVKQMSPGQVRMTVTPQFYWAPDRTGLVGFANPDDDFPPVNAQDLVGNANKQWWGSVNGQIPVNDHAASQFIVNLPFDGEVLKGVPFQIEVIAQDSEGEVDENFKERINLAAVNISQNSIDLPEGSQLLPGGKAYFTVTCWVVTSDLRITVGVESDRYARYYGISDPITVVEPVIDTPDTLIVKDWPNDQGGALSLVWPFSDNHPGFGENPEIDYYQIYYDLNHAIYQYDQPIGAIDTSGTGMDSMRVNIEMPDNDEHTFWVRAVWSPTWPGTQAAPGSGSEPGQVTISSDQFKLIRVNGKNVQNEVSQMSTIKAEATLSGAAMGIGRAIDNIKPEKLTYLFADKEGEAVKLHWKKVIYGINGTKEKFPVSYQVYSHSSKAYFDLDTEGTLEAAIGDTAFTINTDELSKFFCVRAIDSDNKSDLSARMGKWGFAVRRDSKPVYNYLSLPLNNASISNAKTFAENVSGLAAVLKLDPSTNSFSKFYLPAIKFGDNFSLSGGKPVLVSADNTAPEKWFYTGAVPAPKSVRFTLNNSAAGRYNEIIVPFDKTNIKTADDLAKDIGGVDAVLKLDPATNSFSKFWLPAIKYGENFSVKPGEAVLINVGTKAPSTWPVYTSN